MQIQSIVYLLNRYDWKKFAVLYPAHKSSFSSYSPETAQELQALKDEILHTKGYNAEFISYNPECSFANGNLMLRYQGIFYSRYRYGNVIFLTYVPALEKDGPK